MSRQTQRRNLSRVVREQAARSEYLIPVPLHPNNGDEGRYANENFIGNATKGLAHDAKGEVVPLAYEAYLGAIRSGANDDFEALVTNGHFGWPVQDERRRFVNPQSGYAFDLEGTDPGQLTMRAAPAFASAEEAGEMVELYWMALLRDTPFADYATSPVAKDAAKDLSNLSDFRGPKDTTGKVTPALLFRDSYEGCTIGPYISQFLLQPVNFGAQQIDTTILTNKPGVDFNVDFATWLKIINGWQPPVSSAIGGGGRVYCFDGRAASQYVHVDVLFQAYFVACVNLLGNHYRASISNPYGQLLDGGTGAPLPTGTFGTLSQVGFGTFGAPAIASLVCEAGTRALKHMWYQKWLIHRRLRPEEFGGRVEAQRLGLNTYPFHSDLFNSTVLPKILGNSKWKSHLLPVAFPEGSAVHTSYGSGHATVAGACVTLLKAFFDGSQVIQNPVVPDPANPAKLIPYVAPPKEPPLTVGGELNKLASNISQARNIAGVHWRTDATESNKLGEEVAISMLRDMNELYNEPFSGFSLTKFDGTTIAV